MMYSELLEYSVVTVAGLLSIVSPEFLENSKLKVVY